MTSLKGWSKTITYKQFVRADKIDSAKEHNCLYPVELLNFKPETASPPNYHLFLKGDTS